MSTIFEKIISGNIPSYKICENNKFFAFLDINPKSRGHVLVIPKKPTQWVWEVEKMGKYFEFCKPIILAQIKVFSPLTVSIKTFGTEVPHAHIHLIPVYKNSENDWENPKLTDLEFQDIAKAIISCLN